MLVATVPMRIMVDVQMPETALQACTNAIVYLRICSTASDGPCRVQEERQHLRWRVECVTAEAREVIEAEAADAVASADPRSDLEIPQEVSRAANLLSELIREARPALAHHQQLQSNLTSHQAQKNEHKGQPSIS